MRGGPQSGEVEAATLTGALVRLGAERLEPNAAPDALRPREFRADLEPTKGPIVAFRGTSELPQGLALLR